MQKVTHLIAFGFQIVLVKGIGPNFYGYNLDNFQPVTLQTYPFFGVIGHESHFGNAHFA